jgi:hypothetical protein
VLALTPCCHAQSTNGVQQLVNYVASASWYDAHFSYSPSARASQRLGGGADIFTPITSTSNAVTAFTRFGYQWAWGGAQGVSGQVGADLPIKPLQFLSTSTNGFAHDFTVDPFAVTGLAAPLSSKTVVGFTIPGHNDNKTVVPIEGYGVMVQMVKFDKDWSLNAAFDGEDWIGLGWVYSVATVFHRAM